MTPTIDHTHTDRPDPLKVSVVIPSLNRANLINPTIESILGQDYPDVELIVVDSGSTDGTIDILRSCGDRIRWISEPDHGRTDVINKGRRMSQGVVFAWLNSDDVRVLPDAVTKAVRFLEAHPDVDVVFGDCGVIDAEGNKVGMFYGHDWDPEYAIEHNDHCVPQPASFVRHGIIDKVGFLDTSVFGMDKELWFRIGLLGKIWYIPELPAHARNIEGKTWDGLAQAENCVIIAGKFFARTDVPPALLAKKNRAINNAYIQGASLAYGRGFHVGKAAECLFRAGWEGLSNIVRILYHVLRASVFLLSGRSEIRRPPMARIQTISDRGGSCAD